MPEKDKLVSSFLPFCKERRKRFGTSQLPFMVLRSCRADVPACAYLCSCAGVEAESSVPAAQTEQSRGDHSQTQERQREQKQRYLRRQRSVEGLFLPSLSSRCDVLLLMSVNLFFFSPPPAAGTGTGMVSPSKAPGTVSLSPARVPDVDPIDAAAHLQLLGESLSLIGHRLQETEVSLRGFQI